MEIIKTVLEFVVYVLAGYAIGDIIVSIILYKKNPALAWEVRRTFLSLFEKKAKVVEKEEESEDDGFSDYYGDRDTNDCSHIEIDDTHWNECLSCGVEAEEGSFYCSECDTNKEEDCEGCKYYDGNGCTSWTDEDYNGECPCYAVKPECQCETSKNVDVTQPAPTASCDNAKDCVLCPFTQPCNVRQCNCKKDETNG
jgi:hypothetical protein